MKIVHCDETCFIALFDLWWQILDSIQVSMRNVHIVYMDTHNGQVYLFFIFQFLLFIVCVISLLFSSVHGFISVVVQVWFYYFLDISTFSLKRLPWRWSKVFQAHFSLMSQWLEFNLYYLSLLEVLLIFFFMHPSHVIVDLVHPNLYISEL